MRRILFGLAAAGLLVFGMTAPTHAQVPVTVGSPYVGSGGFVAPSPGVTYSSGYVGVQPAAPATMVLQPVVPRTMPVPVVSRGFRARTYRYPVAGAYRVRNRPFFRRPLFLSYW
jgi:hypothetical protein